MAWRQDGRFLHREVYRFPNASVRQDDSLAWDLEPLCREVLNGLAASREQGFAPDSLGIDTWGMDYVPLDRRGTPVAPVYCYRDSRGERAVEQAHLRVPFEAMYERTGSQYQPFNTVYQLFADKLEGGSTARCTGIPALIVLYTGIRKGELIALKWENIDLSTERLSVNKAVAFHNNSVSVKTPKTKSGYRMAPIPKVITPILEKAKAD